MEPPVTEEMSADTLLTLLAETYTPFAAVIDLPVASENFATPVEVSRNRSQSLPAKTVVQHAEKRDTPQGMQPLRF